MSKQINPQFVGRPVSGRFAVKFWRLVCCLTAAVALSVFVATALSTHTSAQNSDAGEAAFNRKADKILKGIRGAVDEERRAAPNGNLHSDNSVLKHLSRIARVKAQSDGGLRLDVAVTLTEDSEEQLKAAGFPVESRVGNVATLSLDVDQLAALAEIEGVQKIFASVKHRPMNDRARQATGVDNNGQRVVTQTGRGVVVGIIDTGIDFRHLDFTVPGSGGRQTRIKAMLDMTEYGSSSPDPGWNYTLPGKSGVVGHLYTEADINAALQTSKPANQNLDPIKERDKNGHGTHVAGTAAGNGLAAPTAGTYAGMAPEADLVIVKASRQNDGSDDFDTTDMINAMEFVRQKAQELGEPFVINMSIGGQIGPHDGTNPDERAIDNLVNGGTGRAVCVAAGNEGGSSIHARATVPAAGSQTLDFNLSGGPSLIDLYQNRSDRFTITVTGPDGVALGPVAYDANGFGFGSGQASNQYVAVYNANDNKGDSDPANDQPDIMVLFKPNAPAGMWKVTLTDADGNANQSYDAWAEGDGAYFSSFVDNDSHLVVSPGTSRGAITVGAYITRSSTQTIGAPASFTSPGPTADGRQKPDVGAPGYYLYSARSTDVADANFGTIGTGSNAPTDATHYTGLAGTSMGTPVTTGAVALLLQSAPALPIDQIKSLLTTYAVKDIYTGADQWTSRLGFGKLNIFNSINHSGGGNQKYSISGRMTDPNGSSVFDLQIFLSGSSSAMARTDANGNFSFTGLTAGGNYTVAPSFQTSMTFAPASYTFNNLSANQTTNFVRTTATFYSVHGRIVDQNGNGMSGISVEFPISFSAAGHLPVLPAVTDINGYYTASLTAGVDHQVRPSSQAYNFSPALATLSNLSSDQTVNFSGASKLAIDQAEFFVHQHYVDFLNREPDASGLAFWSNQITECQQPGATCNAVVRRVNVSAAFFLSIEFQETGYLVERLYKASYGDATGTSNFGPTHTLAVPIVRLNEFLPDSQQIGNGLIVGNPGWEQVLENNKVAFILQFVQRSRFTTAYPIILTPAQFVDGLFAHAGVAPTAAERSVAINEFAGAGNTVDVAARGRALRRVAENPTLNQNEKNRAFVLMEYFGYLRRNPNDPQDTDYSGYDFWLSKLNQFNGNFVNADMVQAFIDSGEYRARFGP